jgi:hypothetical protein
MFAKLLKHEWRAVSGALSILSLAALGAAAVATIVLRLLISYGDKAPALSTVGGLLLIGSILALVVYAVGSLIFLLFRFYKSRYTDEGYLTFTLPVTNHQILLSSLLIMLAWSAITITVVFFGLAMIILMGTTTSGLINTELLQDLRVIADAISTIMTGQTKAQAITILAGVSIVVSFLMSTMLMVTAITIGSIAAKKHKVLASIAAYYIINMGVSLITSLVSIPIMINSANASSLSELASGTIGLLSFQVGLELVIIVAGYFVTAHLMKKKLDLP